MFASNAFKGDIALKIAQWPRQVRTSFGNTPKEI